MCMVSMVHDHGHQEWDKFKKWDHEYIPDYPKDPYAPWPPATPKNPYTDLDTLYRWRKAIEEMIKAAEAYDKDTGQPHCEDPMKINWMAEVDKRTKELEAEQKSNIANGTNLA